MNEESEDVDTTKLYEVLGVEKTATEQQIRSSYKKLVLKHHPDKGGDPDTIKEINFAYEVLKDQDKRELYDKYGLEGVKNGGGGMPGGFDDIFSMFSGGGRARRGPREKPQMKPTVKELDVKLEEVYNGKLIEMKHKRMMICDACQGKGGKNVCKCPACNGEGFVIKTVQIGPGMYQRAQAKCSKCDGKGEIMKPEDVCKVCKGKKVIEKEKVIEVAIEQGVPDGHIIKYPGEGNEHPDAQAGLLAVKVNIKKHQLFERKGADLFMEKSITLKQALLGFNFEIPFLDGSKITISSASGSITSDGDMKTVIGKGMPIYGQAMSFGNLIINFKVVFPKANSLNAENKELLQKV